MGKKNRDTATTTVTTTTTTKKSNQCADGTRACESSIHPFKSQRKTKDLGNELGQWHGSAGIGFGRVGCGRGGWA